MKRKKIIGFLANLLGLDVILIDKQNVQNSIKYESHMANIELVRSCYNTSYRLNIPNFDEDIKRQAFLKMYDVLNEMGAIKMFKKRLNPFLTENEIQLKVLVSKD